MTGGMQLEKLRDFVDTVPARVVDGYRKSQEAEKKDVGAKASTKAQEGDSKAASNEL